MRLMFFVLSMLFAVTASADRYMESIENTTNQDTYCVAFALMASTGSYASWRGAPLEFKELNILQYHELVKQQIAKTESAAMPADGIYMVTDDLTDHQIKLQRAFFTYGWNWIKSHANSLPVDKAYPDKPDWTLITNTMADECKTKNLRQQFTEQQ